MFTNVRIHYHQCEGGVENLQYECGRIHMYQEKTHHIYYGSVHRQRASFILWSNIWSQLSSLRNHLQLLQAKDTAGRLALFFRLLFTSFAVLVFCSAINIMFRCGFKNKTPLFIYLFLFIGQEVQRQSAQSKRAKWGRFYTRE